MAYASDLSKLLTAQFTRFATLNRHQLAGQVANLDFWLAESLHCLGVIDGYRQRFERLKAAQAIHVAMHGTVGLAPGEQHNKGGSALPRAVPDTELTVARRALCDATYRFLVRCFNEALIDEKTLRGQCHRLELSVEAADLRRES